MSAVKGVVRLRVAAGKAAPSPAIGQALGPLGVNMMEFCRSFNDRTAHLTPSIPVPVQLTAMNDRTFSYTIKTPPTTWFLKKAAQITSGSELTGQKEVGQVSLRHIYEIAKVKQQDELLDYIELESLCKNIIGSAKSMGLRVACSCRSMDPSRLQRAKLAVPTLLCWTYQHPLPGHLSLRDLVVALHVILIYSAHV
ncbi:hypothetical protein SPRG_03544 [Saprolegnia parasitica CBS 223.65]|uniref:Large ribosomal subunit protein uL11m n=1 Tax=Saprolegnia parasitica (strain CBS 223.65) TaxID=695850 RepID=A0A067CLP9_SAPPC|nr:hypothetical protein SPRG_03544 [Saprolegnia parasitica CBS 223.65]KDO31624.1 hypothetical protein SPRG_03544 [Saprolegnia parasitica CBS 223.65]|eukprot:XP_012197514.1 hypothetical protein SPRG_03544 [Saprolegnia parasitica CBS 223.65]